MLLLVPIVAFSQSSILYNADGTLKADKQFKITKEMLIKAPAIEKDLLASVYNNVRYPAMAKENNITGSVIVKLVTTDGNTGFEIVKSSDIVFKEALERFFKGMPGTYLYSKAGYHGPGVFYLPIKFQLLKNRFNQTLKSNKVLTIEAIEPAPDTIRTMNIIRIN
jgi:hypothetical protein